MLAAARAVLASLAVLAAGVAAPTLTTPPASYPNPGVVTGDTGTHDPSVAKTPGGGYLLAYTGANIQLKTSTDRTAWHNAGAVFPGGASWTLPRPPASARSTRRSSWRPAPAARPAAGPTRAW